MNICVPMMESDKFVVNPNYKDIKFLLIINSGSYFFQIIDMRNWDYSQMIDYLCNANVKYFMVSNISKEDEENLAIKNIKIHPIDLTINALDNANTVKVKIDNDSKLEWSSKPHR